MNQLKQLKSKLNRLYGQRAGAYTNRDYSLVMHFSQEIEHTKKLIAESERSERADG